MELYSLKTESVRCPKCDEHFATTTVTSMPPITVKSKIEADLHRVMPDSKIRAASLAMCPNCLYTTWTTAFFWSSKVVGFLPHSPAIDDAKKFGHAVHSGRLDNKHSLDNAILALNGYWCAREAFQSGEKFLQVAKQEYKEALDDKEWKGYRGLHYYQMAEIFRLSGDFHDAVNYYMMVDKDALLPKELLDHQIKNAKQGNSSPIVLPEHIIEGVYRHKLGKPIITSTNILHAM